MYKTRFTFTAYGHVIHARHVAAAPASIAVLISRVITRTRIDDLDDQGAGGGGAGGGAVQGVAVRILSGEGGIQVPTGTNEELVQQQDVMQQQAGRG